MIGIFIAFAQACFAYTNCMPSCEMNHIDVKKHKKDIILPKSFIEKLQHDDCTEDSVRVTAINRLQECPPELDPIILITDYQYVYKTCNRSLSFKLNEAINYDTLERKWIHAKGVAQFDTAKIPFDIQITLIGVHDISTLKKQFKYKFESTDRSFIFCDSLQFRYIWGTRPLPPPESPNTF